MNTRISQILEYIPLTLRGKLQTTMNGLQNIEEIRFRADKPISVFASGKIARINEIISSPQDVKAIFNAICEHSIYAYLEEIKQGFITIKGGHRVGICGRVVACDGNIENIKDISGINIRVAREVIGSADKIIKEIAEPGFDEVRIHSTLIISPPQCGKTTMLRDLARQCSNFDKNVSIVDCRGEIAACYHGIPQNDVGSNTDVLDGAPKAEGMMMLLRAMAPQVLITDEIVTDCDISAVSQALSGGVAVLASVHGATIEDILENERYLPLFGKCGFSNIVLLSRENGAGTIEEVRKLCLSE
ncbi:MAG: stage III sporulation protein AA [Oscillospiraceae bacterium]|nr:stage III sporulation protein AA [Oscillospiraceae bacterium]